MEMINVEDDVRDAGKMLRVYYENSFHVLTRGSCGGSKKMVGVVGVTERRGCVRGCVMVCSWKSGLVVVGRRLCKRRSYLIFFMAWEWNRRGGRFIG